MKKNYFNYFLLCLLSFEKFGANAAKNELDEENEYGIPTYKRTNPFQKFYSDEDEEAARDEISSELEEQDDSTDSIGTFLSGAKVKCIRNNCFIVTEGLVVNNTTPVIPWVGVLRAKREPWGSTITVAGIILIAEKVAIANAHEIGLLKTYSSMSSYVEFRDDDYLYNVNVERLVLHPEYKVFTSNTVSLLFLNPSAEHTFEWRPISWPLRPFQPWERLFLHGIPDRSRTLEHSISKMLYMNSEKCKEFYRSEGIDFENIRPSHSLCAVDVNANDTCVYEPGMALATFYGNSYTLVGISTYSPGCSVPARFIEIYPYTEWVENEILNAKNAWNLF